MAKYIEREALLGRIQIHLTQDWRTIGKKQFYEGYYLGLSEAEIMVAQATTTEVEPVRHGGWIEPDEEESDWRCSICGSYVCICVCGKDRTKRMPFCPVCGARMDLGGNEDGQHLCMLRGGDPRGADGVLDV